MAKTRSWKAWTPREDALLLLKKSEGVSRKDIAVLLPGRTVSGMDERWKILRERSGVKARKPGRPPIGEILYAMPRIAQAKPDTGPIRGRRISVCATDQELIARIAERGLTAGMFGDPPAGRSALDQKQQESGRP